MMIDGNAGAGCDFTVAGWDATLPITLVNFQGHNYKTGNKLFWTTATEINNDYFIVQKSADARTFTNIGTVKGHGNSNTSNQYTFIDETSPQKASYYRLKQIDFDGNYSFSKILGIESSKGDQDINIYPNPSKDNFSFDISISTDEIYSVSCINITGNEHREQINISEGTNTYQVNDFKTYPTVYILSKF